MLKRLNTKGMKRVISVFLLLLFMMSVTIGDTPAHAAGGAASLHMNGGTGYNFEFVFSLLGGGPNQTITIPGNGTVAAIYSPSGNPLGLDDSLLYVVVTDTNGAPVGIILPNAIGHRSNTTAVLQADGSMGPNGLMVGNSGTINFWFNGFTSSGTQPGTSYIVANKIWLNADGTPFTDTTPSLSFLLNGTTTAGSLPVTNIPMLPGVPVLVLDGNYTISEPSISGFNLISIFSTTMTPNLTTRSANAPVTSNSDYSATFTNQAIPNSIPYTIYGLKIGNGIPNGDPVDANIFDFTVTDQATGLVVSTGTNEAWSGSGSTAYMPIDFTPIVYTMADVGQQKTYIIREVGTTNTSWTFDSGASWTYYVNVSLQGSTIVGNTPEFIEIEFDNFYNARGSFVPVASKTAAGGSMVPAQFTFAVLDPNGNAVSTGFNVSAGNSSSIAFTPITYSQAGTYNYTIVETNPQNRNGWRLMNTAPFAMTVTVTDPGGGADFITSATYSPDPVTFINVYESTGFLSLSAQKTATGGALRAGQFQFAVVDNNVAPPATIATGTNDANGNVSFSSIAYHSYTTGDVGFHQYSIVETSTSANGWTTSSVTYPLLVSVVDNGNGEMTVTPFNISGSNFVFTNVYGSTGSVTLVANKQVNGGTLSAGQFAFAVQNELGGTIATGVNNANGSITFTPISYTNADVGTHTYTILETSAGGGGWTPSSVIYTVTVLVVDNGDGTITATPTYPGGSSSNVIFVNTYQATGSIALSATKVINGSTLAAAAGLFNFAVLDNNGIIVSTGTNDVNGNILFSAIPYNSAGVYNYTIVERDSGSSSWQTDNTVANVTVSVVDLGGGMLSATQIDPDPDFVDITFTNTFIPPPSGTLIISKAFTGLPAGFDVFNPNSISPISFLVVGVQNPEVYRAIVPFNRANFSWNPSTGTFDCVLPGLPPGTYTVTESGGHAPGYQLSISTQWPSISLTTTGATFYITDNYTPSPVTPEDTPALTVNKIFHGLTAAERPANFKIVITGPGGFNETLSLSQAMSGSGGTFTNLAPGTYTINEVNSNVSGYNMTVSINNTPVTLPFAIQVTGSSGHISATLDNFYTPVPPPSDNLTISKSFTGLPVGFDVFDQNRISPISFLVIGTNSANAEVYRQIIPFNRTNFTLNSITGTYDCQLQNLPVATYNVYESGGHVPGFELNITVPPPPPTVTPTGIIFNILNRYSLSQVTPADHPALTVNKVFHGLTQAERPANFQIVITGPGGFNQSINLNQALSGSGGSFINLAPGNYTINEVNGDVPNYVYTVSINNRPVTLPYTVQIASGHITVTLDNTYSPAPPAPKTGVNHNIFLPVLLFSLGAVNIAGAVIYRKRAK